MLGGYTAISTGTAEDVANTDSLNTAIAKLQKQIKDEAAAGVRSISGTTGTVILGNGLQASGAANGSISAKVVTANGLSVGTDGIAMSLASASANGAMSSADFSKLAGIAAGAQVNVLEGVQIGGTDLTISSKKVNIETEGTYSSSNKIATQSTVTNAIGALNVSEYAQGILANDDLSFSIKSISQANGLIGAGQTDFTLAFADAYSSNSKIATQTTVSNAIASIDGAGLAVASDGTVTVTTQDAGDNTTNIATTAFVTTAVNHALDSEVTFKGVTSTQPTTPENGDMWKASAAFTVAAADAGEGVAFTTKVGDTIIYKSISGAQNNGWYLIPSADDVEDTWRAIKVNGTEVLGSGTSTGDIDFVAGSNITITAADATSPAIGKTITVAHSTTTSHNAAAVKVGNDTAGHVVIGDALQASDIARTATTGNHPIAATNVESALVELKTAIDTSDSNAVTGVTLNGTSVVTDHVAVVTTGTTDDIAMTSNGGQITASLVEFDSFIFDCGSATTNTTQNGTQFANKSSHAQ